VRQGGYHIFSRQSAHKCRRNCRPYASAGRPLPSGRFLLIISTRGWIDPRAIGRLEGLGELKNAVTSSGIETATFQLVAWCLNQLRYGVLSNSAEYSIYLQNRPYLQTFRRCLLIIVTNATVKRREILCVCVCVCVCVRVCMEETLHFKGNTFSVFEGS
jgi:hypothetical protein